MPWKSYSNMIPLIASDIFGRTPALEALAEELSSNSGSPLIVDPYEGVDQHFDTELEAYAAFQRTIGLEGYIQIVSTAIQRTTNPLLLIGFSVGASAVWAISGESALPVGTRAVCFYGSQIRHFIDVNPRIEMDLFFPEHELHFDVTDLIAKLSLKKGAFCHHLPYLHGFMNKQSPHFNPEAYHHHLHLLWKKAGPGWAISGG